MIKRVEPNEELQEVVERLVEGLHPESSYLFGSYARGTQMSGASDIDLLVVVPESDLPRHQREAESYDLLWGLRIPVDVIVMTRDEFLTAIDVKTSLPRTIQENGKLLYAAG